MTHDLDVPPRDAIHPPTRLLVTLLAAACGGGPAPAGEGDPSSGGDIGTATGTTGDDGSPASDDGSTGTTGGGSSSGGDATDDTAADTTTGDEPPGEVLTVDKVVSDAAELRACLLQWEADWDGTVPSGKDATDARVLGLDTSVVGAIDLSGITLPQRVYVRAVGSFHDDFTSSTFVEGTIDLSGSTHLWLALMDVRAPDAGGYSTGLVNLDDTHDCGLIRSSVSGYPFALTPGATGTTSYAISPNGAVGLTVRHNVYRYFRDGFAKWRGHTVDLWLEGNMGLYSGGDDHTVAAGAVLDDPMILANYFDRHHAKAAGVHNDGWQLNGNNGGSAMNRYTLRYNVGYRGTWTGTGESTSNGWQLWYLAGAGTPSTGPWLAEHNLFANGQQRGIDRIPGTGTSTVRYCAAIDSDVASDQVANARFPRIIGADEVERNFVTAPHDTYTDAGGNGGVTVVLGDTPDHTALLQYMEAVPTDTTDLWDIRPKAGTPYHPDHLPSDERVGPYELWAKLLAGDPEVVLSRVGWPVAPLFIADFDHGDNFWGGYTGSFDADGNNS